MKFNLKSAAKNLGKKISKKISKNSPTILTALGVSGFITTCVFLIKEAPVAEQIIAELEEENEEVKVVDKVKATWKTYLPAMVTGAASITCFVSANSINCKRNMVLASAYTITDTAYREFRDKATDLLGEKKVKEIKDRIAEDKVHNNPVNTNEIIMTDKPDTLCYDIPSARYFYSNIEKLRQIEARVAQREYIEMFISLNELYDEFGIGHSTLGSEYGLDITQGVFRIDYTSVLSEDGTPCLALNYDISPRYDYRDLR